MLSNAARTGSRERRETKDSKQFQAFLSSHAGHIIHSSPLPSINRRSNFFSLLIRSGIGSRIEKIDSSHPISKTFSCHLCTLIIITDADGTIFAESIRPEAFNRRRASTHVSEISKRTVCKLPGKGIVGKYKPETKDRFGEHIKNSIGNDFGIDVDDAGTVSDTPDTAACLASLHIASQTE